MRFAITKPESGWMCFVHHVQCLIYRIFYLPLLHCTAIQLLLLHKHFFHINLILAPTVLYTSFFHILHISPVEEISPQIKAVII